MLALSDHISKKSVCAFTALVIILSLLALSCDSFAGFLQTQGGGSTGPSFPCEKATTAVEKLICGDAELSRLDLEYSRLYNDQLRDSDTADIAGIRNEARFFLQVRERCVNGSLDSALIKSYEIACLTMNYDRRIADLSDLPKQPPAEWTQQLVDGAFVYADRNRGLRRTRSGKPLPEIFFKTPGADTLFRITGTDLLWPSRLDRSLQYRVYRNVLGSLTYVQEYRGVDLEFEYFFNRDGRLAAQERRFSRLADGGLTDYYGEYETVFYVSSGQEIRRVRQVYYKGKIGQKREDLAGPPLAKPSFDSFTDLWDARFKRADVLDPEQLGLAYLHLSDGYPTQTRVLNFEPEPLEICEHSVPQINYGSIDLRPGAMRGVLKPIGTLSGKRVYSVTYPGDLTVILVEREADRYLPILYVQPPRPIELGVALIESQDILFYSSSVPGSGGFTDEWYFILDHGIPKKVEYATVVGDELRKIVPEHCEPWKGGRLNLNTLTYSQMFRGDCPNGVAFIAVQLGFEQGHFVVKSSKWQNNPN